MEVLALNSVGLELQLKHGLAATLYIPIQLVVLLLPPSLRAVLQGEHHSKLNVA